MRSQRPCGGGARRRDGRASLWALAVGVSVGCLELAILWLADDRDFWARVGSVATGRLWFSLAELVFFALCMAAYLWLAGRPIRRPWLAGILALLASLDLMAHFPPLFTMLNLLADRPSLLTQRLESPLYRSLLFDPEVLSMTAPRLSGRDRGHGRDSHVACRAARSSKRWQSTKRRRGASARFGAELPCWRRCCNCPSE